MSWNKDYIGIELFIPDTGEPDTTAHVVEFQPIDQAYPSGAVNATQCSINKEIYQPDSDLDEWTHYDIYVDGTNYMRLLALKSTPAVS